MEFFDLNVPYHGGGRGQNLEAQKNARLKVVVKAMELGYSGVACNVSIRGVMSDSDRCTIHPFPLSSILKLAPSLSASVKFHRKLLGVAPNTPFRQYNRLTVTVDNIIHAAALNSGNPVLKTYDLVAVMPLNQAAFDQACKVSEVDLITIDFSHKVPFRLKLPMINAAIKRGINFEITYSHLISDVQVRRQMLSGAKMLVEWTRGKNIIFSSAAATANELRGPNDVANLSTLLGLSMEKAKAAISKNCRSLLVRSLLKKQYYKEAIKVERVSDGGPLLSKKWDPISSGEGDLSLDDIAKSFSDARKVPISVNWSNVSFQSSDVTSSYKFSKKKLESAGPPEETPSSCGLVDGVMPVNAAASIDQTGDAAVKPTFSSGLDSSDCFGVVADENPSSSWSKDHTSKAKELGLNLSNDGLKSFAGPGISSISGATQPDVTLSKIHASNGEVGVKSGNENVILTASAKVASHSEACDEEIRSLDELEAVIDTCDKPMEQLLEKKEEEQKDANLANDGPIEEGCAGVFEGRVMISTDEFHVKENYMKTDEQKQDSGVTPDMTVEEGLIPMQRSEQEEVTGGSNMRMELRGKNRLKRKSSLPAHPLPFKGLLKLGVIFKKARRRL
ncbi:protein GAMETOPHYTE DEFECTIVE 1-like isoform X2 [Aristolochia californica]|uniref:protein GAMETOPHYTE DEFECTIVE 1-like isoform X2 n=1 Tax=Aristolochia californica TaxID=171875 RepID=UPI0035DB39D6